MPSGGMSRPVATWSGLSGQVLSEDGEGGHDAMRTATQGGGRGSRVAPAGRRRTGRRGSSRVGSAASWVPNGGTGSVALGCDSPSSDGPARAGTQSPEERSPRPADRAITGARSLTGPLTMTIAIDELAAPSRADPSLRVGLPGVSGWGRQVSQHSWCPR